MPGRIYRKDNYLSDLDAYDLGYLPEVSVSPQSPWSIPSWADTSGFNMDLPPAPNVDWSLFGGSGSSGIDLGKLTPWGALADFGSNLVSNIFGVYENRQTREHNLELAQMQNQWNIEQWDRENAYNLPQNQMARLQAAGLSPDLMYSGGPGNLQSAQSPQMTSGAPASPATWNPYQIGLMTKQMELLDAQAENQRSEANLKESQTVGQDIDNEYKPRILDNQLEVGNVNVELLSSQRDWTDSDRERIEQVTTNLAKEFDKLVEEIDLISSNRELVDWELAFKQATSDLEIDLLRAIKNGHTSQSALNDALRKVAGADYDVKVSEKGILDIRAKNEKKWGGYLMFMEGLGSALQGVASGVVAGVTLATGIKGMKKPKATGFQAILNSRK